MRYGIKDEYWQRLGAVFGSHPEVERVVLYGSRAKGTNKPYSDVDIALVGDGLETDELLRIAGEVDDLLLPFFFDISIYNKIDDAALLESISRTGIVVYERGRRQ